ncbi:hypothetical protein O6H91_10G043600 [Diphasiastrum complanatum]|uniref:Uncharacterized protein n=1 Tax=Diphasiastrum complanatum TaxID=34168 RepID=A0ACC2CGE8_DIPCM|nr:hypothetical protein O6H91_10G043600 [Diphasiastrum complanatum]
MAAMEKPLATNSMLEPLAEEAVREKTALETVQKEMSEADEANLLEEEDMHVFDREPLSDRLPLVSCNTCKKPIKASQYSAHAERCRSITTVDDALIDLDGGSGHKKPPRKARKKMSPHENNGIGESERSQSMEGDEAAPVESSGMSVVTNSQLFGAAGVDKFRSSKNFVDGGRTLVAEDAILTGALKPRLSDSEGPSLSSMQAGKNAGTFSLQPMYNAEGVDAHLATGFRRNLQSGRSPQPLATKVYYLTNHQRMRAVLSSLFQENTERHYPISAHTTGSMPVQSGGMSAAAPTMFSEFNSTDASHQRPRQMLGMKK